MQKFCEKWRLTEIIWGTKQNFRGTVAPLLSLGYVPDASTAALLKSLKLTVN